MYTSPRTCSPWLPLPPALWCPTLYELTPPATLRRSAVHVCSLSVHACMLRANTCIMCEQAHASAHARRVHTRTKHTKVFTAELYSWEQELLQRGQEVGLFGFQVSSPPLSVSARGRASKGALRAQSGFVCECAITVDTNYARSVHARSVHACSHALMGAQLDQYFICTCHKRAYAHIF